MATPLTTQTGIDNSFVSTIKAQDNDTHDTTTNMNFQVATSATDAMVEETSKSVNKNEEQQQFTGRTIHGVVDYGDVAMMEDHHHHNTDTSPDNNPFEGTTPIATEAANLIMGFPERKVEEKNEHSSMFVRGEIAPTMNINSGGQAAGDDFNMVIAVNPPGSNNENSTTAEVVGTAVHELAEVVAAANTAAASAEGAEDSPLALAAMQEAATIVMEAENQKKRKASEITTESSNIDTNTSSTTSHNDAGNNRGGEGEGSQQQQQQPAPKRATTSTRTSWAERLKQLAKYKQQHGNLLIPIRYKLNPSLGKFVHNTREQYKLYHKMTPPGYKKKCSLTAERIQQLEALGFAWTTERTKKQDEGWSKRFQQLTEFKDKHGHTMVPHGYAVDPSFAEWCHRQRTTYASMLKDDKPNPAIQKRMEQLRQVGFNFTVHSDKWMYHWEQLKAYKEQHGDCQVPTHYSKNSKLGRWVNTQRHQRRLLSRGKKSCMTQERINMLDQLGFSWEVRPSIEQRRLQPDDSTWVARLAELTEYKSSHDDFLKVNPITMPQLFAWCHEQRELLRKQHTAVATTDQRGDVGDGDIIISIERIDDLAAIGFDKDVELLDIPSKSSTNDPSTSIEASNNTEKVNDAIISAPPVEDGTTGKVEDASVKDTTTVKDSTAKASALDSTPNPQLEAGRADDTQHKNEGDNSSEVQTTKVEGASAKPESGVEEIEPIAV